MTRGILAIAVALLLNGVGTPAPDARAAVETSPASADELDRLLAPVALYPDQLLAQMLLCAANPPRSAALDEWLKQATSAERHRAAGRREKAGFEPSFVALALFPACRRTRWPGSWTGPRARARPSLPIARRCSTASSACGRRPAMPGTLKTTPQQEVETQDHVERPAGHRHRAGQPAGRLRAAIQPAGRLHAARTSTTVVVQEDDDDATRRWRR